MPSVLYEKEKFFTLGEKTKVKSKVKTQRLILSGRLRGLVLYLGNSGLSKKVANYHKLYTVFSRII